MAIAQPVVAPSVETVPVPSDEDAADDAAIWVHPTQPEHSRIIVTDKSFGLIVHSLDGAIVQSLELGPVNNVDVRYGMRVDGQDVDVACATERTEQSILVLVIDRAGALSPAGAIATGLEPAYGLCMYRDAAGGTYVFACDKEGMVEQYLLRDVGDGTIDGVLVRRFDVGGQCEGMVADDALGHLYVGEEEVAIWRYDASPSAGDARAGVDVAGENLVADIEGLALYDAGGGAGYLIASSQGDGAFSVYRRGNGAFLGRFTIGGAAGIDPVTHTDGIEVTNASLGPAFPFGVFVCQDDENDWGAQNFKLVRWERIAEAMSPALLVNTAHPTR